MKFKIPEDKRHHFVYSFCICITICILLSAFFKAAPIYAFVATLAIGIYKEFKDATDPKHTSDIKDIVANVIGMSTAVCIFYIGKLLNILF